MKDKVISKVSIPMSNNIGGESLSLVVQFIDNGEQIQYQNDLVKNPGIFMNQRIVLHSYCNDASINLYGDSLTPDMLRKIANQLELANTQALVKKVQNQQAKEDEK